MCTKIKGKRERDQRKKDLACGFGSVGSNLTGDHVCNWASPGGLLCPRHICNLFTKRLIFALSKPYCFRASRLALP